MFWSKLWILFKRFWYLPVILILIVALSVVMKKNNIGLDLFNNMIDAYKKEIAEIERLNKEKEKQKAELEAKYQLILKQIESQYASDNVKLAEEERKRVREIVEKYKDNDEMMSAAFRSEFGLR